MSRDIKFRVWDGSMRYVDLYYFEEEGIREFPTKYSDHLSVMQFTGLKDKNGKDIYEGDIVSHEDAYGPCAIEYQPAEYVACDRRGMGYDPCANCEVIGNIHENPELLTP